MELFREENRIYSGKILNIVNTKGKDKGVFDCMNNDNFIMLRILKIDLGLL